jgi:cupin superfamily protein
MLSMDLSELLQPDSAETFLASTWGRTYRHVPGWSGKFAPLLPWERLNAVLQEHRLDVPRLRLMRESATAPASAYLHYEPSCRGEVIPRVDPVRVNEMLRQGATLAVDDIHEMVEPIAQLVENLQKTFHEPVRVNAYAGWGTSEGFKPHWDPVDVLVLQIAGRKRWMLYGVATEYPVGNYISAGGEAPTEPVWDQVLEAGDLLYFPRGWWHMAVPLAEPTLHLTVAIINRKGLDFLGWLQEEMTSRAIFRQDLPRFAAPAEQAEHMKRLRDELFAAWDEHALQRFFFHHDARAARRPRFSLPWSAAPSVLPPGDEALVQLTVSRPTMLSVALLAHEKLRPYAPQAEELLGPLLDGLPHSIAELGARANGNMDRESMRTFLGELVVQGLAAVVTADQDSAAPG